MKSQIRRDGSEARGYWAEHDDTNVRNYLKTLAMGITAENAHSFFHHSGIELY